MVVERLVVSVVTAAQWVLWPSALPLVTAQKILKPALGGELEEIWTCKQIAKISSTTVILSSESAAKDALAERSKAVAQGAIP